MLRCRRCRRGVLDLTCLSLVTDESSSAACTIFHVNVDKLPDWMLTSIHQTQWTVGKLNCRNCSARLGGFNFLSRSECPCGQDTAVHLNKSRVDQDHQRDVLAVQPRRTEPARRRGALLTDGWRSRGERSETHRTTPDSVALTPRIDPDTRRHTEDAQPSSFSPLYCISHRRRCSLEEDAGFRSCFCPVDMSSLHLMRSPVSHADDEASVSVAPRRSDIPGGAGSPPQPAEDNEDATSVHAEVSDSVLRLRRRSASEGAAEEELLRRAAAGFQTSVRPSKREKNRLKSQRRKQRRREKWLEEQQASPLDSEDEDRREGLTCAVCLDVYFSPYSCQPCGHVFCEPCLRTLAKNRPTNTPCPLCRTLISHASFHAELNQTAKTFFPKVHVSRKQNFQNASCAKWPLPSFRKNFRSLWESQRNAATAGRGWHTVHRGFTLEALQFNDMHGWLFDIGLVIVCVHSFNWILAFTLFSVLLYYFFF